MENMNGKVKYFGHIPVVPKREMVLSRLGYRKGATMLDSGDLSMIEEAFRLGKALCKPTGAYLFTRISL